MNNQQKKELNLKETELKETKEELKEEIIKIQCIEKLIEEKIQNVHNKILNNSNSNEGLLLNIFSKLPFSNNELVEDTQELTQKERILQNLLRDIYIALNPISLNGSSQKKENNFNTSLKKNIDFKEEKVDTTPKSFAKKNIPSQPSQSNNNYSNEFVKKPGILYKNELPQEYEEKINNSSEIHLSRYEANTPSKGSFESIINNKKINITVSKNNQDPISIEKEINSKQETKPTNNSNLPSINNKKKGFNTTLNKK